MLFYKLTGMMTDEKWAEENNDRRTLRGNILALKRRSDDFNREYRKKDFYFITDASEDTVEAGIICREPVDLSKNAAAFLRAVRLNAKNIAVEEVTMDTIRRMLSRASREDYIDDDDEVLERFDLEKLRRLDFGENLLPEMKKSEMLREAGRALAAGSFVPELERIFAGRARRAAGHPVHYRIETDDREARKTISRTLLSALFANGRIQSRRYIYLDIVPGERRNRAAYDCLYKSSVGGAVVVRLAADTEEEDDRATSERETAEMVCETMKKYQHRVLTVFCFPRECARIKDLFNEYLVDTSFVELKEDRIAGSEAKNVLKLLARENGIRPDKALFAKAQENESYLLPDLKNLFAAWYDHKLKTSVYPQYREIAPTEAKIRDSAPKGSAYDELMGMIGLKEAKAVIERALNYHKAQILFAKKGMKAARPSLHMVFTGNPGTAKTTAARLFASILKENGILSRGHLIEVGRGDLVGKYVGWTAPTIQRKFKDARGGVLFIDEAYSLVDDRDGSYGDEAINTIVQEMENHRDDVVVSFAGYPDKMEKFLQKNPGLRSRIAFHVPFADYGTEDLCGIASLIAGKCGLSLTEEAKARLAEVFDAARALPDFGNGRYARNVIEKARMAQASRLLTLDPETLREEDVATIRAEDIELPRAIAAPPARRIGFASECA